MDIPTQEAPEKVSWLSDNQYIVEELPNVAFNRDHYHKPMFMSSEFVEYTGSVMVSTLQDVVRMRRGMPCQS